MDSEPKHHLQSLLSEEFPNLFTPEAFRLVVSGGAFAHQRQPPVGCLGQVAIRDQSVKGRHSINL